MNSRIISQAARATLEGTKSFPEIIGLLIGAGIECYPVDHSTLRKTFYGPEGYAVSTIITFENLPPIATDFDSAALKANFAFIRGKRVTYFGRQGDQHTEWFPQ